MSNFKEKADSLFNMLRKIFDELDSEDKVTENNCKEVQTKVQLVVEKFGSDYVGFDMELLQNIVLYMVLLIGSQERN